MPRQVTEPAVFSWWFDDSSGSGVSLSPVPTCNIYSPSGTLVVSGGNTVAGPTGWFDYTYNPGGSIEAGRWRGVAITSSTEVALKQRPSFCDVGVGGVDYLDAAVSDHLSSAQAAAAVLDALTADHSTTGTIGAAIGDAGSGASTPAAIADAVCAEITSTHTTPGSVGAKLNLISAGKVTVISAVSADGDVLTFTRSNDYLASEISFSSTGWWDLTAGTVTLSVRRNPGSGTDSLIFSQTDSTASRIEGDGIEQSVFFALSSTQTVDIELGVDSMKYDVELSSTGKYKTLVTGLATGIEDQTRTT
jgi:hypothetical protein